MGVATAIAIIGIAANVGGTLLQKQASKAAQKQASSQANEANELRRQSEVKSKQLADIQSVRAKRAAAREAQIRRAEITASAESQGASGSSPVTGAKGSVSTQAGQNVSFLDTANKLQSQAATLFGQAQEVANRPIFTNTTGAGIADFGNTLFGNNTKIAGLFG